MNAKPKFEFIAPFVSFLLLAAVGALTLTAPPSSAKHPQASPAAAYPNSQDGLKKQMKDTLAAAIAKNKKNASHAVRDLILPDPDVWFANTFGEDNGEKLSETYKSDQKRLEKSLMNQLNYAVKENRTTVTTRPIARASTPNDSLADVVLSSLKRTEALYEVFLSNQGSESNSFAGLFFYDEGMFRTVAWEVFMHLPGAPPDRVRIGGNVAQAFLIHQVNPIPPPEALQKHVSGTVILHAIIAIDGRMKEVQVIRGDQILGEAAVEAVKQWLYRPYLLNGQPVEVDTTIQVVFNIR